MEDSWRENVTMKGKKSLYKDVVFRSKSEALWALYFDLIGIKWKYEPKLFKFNNGIWYKPDFFLPQVNMWAEVKPDKELTREEYTKIETLVMTTEQRCLLLDGEPRNVTFKIFEINKESVASGLMCISSFNDCVVSMYHDYPKREGRFYENSGFGSGYKASEYNETAFIEAIEKLNDYKFVKSVIHEIE